MNHERHMQGGVVDEEAVSFFAVLAQTFAVISAEHDQGVRIQAFRFQKSNQPSDLRVGESDLPVVRAVLVFGGVRSRRTIRIVGIVQVHPRKNFF